MWDERQKKYLRKFPWRKTLWNARQRCNNHKNRDYKYYGAKGIKCLLTADDCELLWIIYDAGSMQHPSIERINNFGSYELTNCKFIERKVNSLRARNNTRMMIIAGQKI